MFNTFPDLLAYILVAPVFLRLALGIPLIMIGHKTVFKNHDKLSKYFTKRKFPLSKILAYKIGVLEILSGILILFGLFTQISAIISIFINMILINIDNKEAGLEHENLTYYIFIGIALALIFTGAGAFALDLPL